MSSCHRHRSGFEACRRRGDGAGQRLLVSIIASFTMLASALCGAAPYAGSLENTAPSARPSEPIKPLPLTQNADRLRASLGRQLFNDVRLSANNKVSCASCHNLAKGGADGLSRSPGLNGELTPVNAPTVLNAAFNFKQFWNGRADTLESQIEMVVRNPAEMGSSWSDVERKVAAVPDYRKWFSASYEDGVTADNIRDAIANYERTLITPNARFDRYLRGDAQAITAEEKAGYAKFKQYGCIACHQGINVGGNMFEKFGVMGDYFASRGNPTEADLGRYAVTKEDGDQHVFKVPSLRNVALTAPYFHDGSAGSLDAAVEVMFRYQLGRVASRADERAIISFLKTLTGEVSDAL
jgi:cytochrome c peroxidase